MTSTSSKLPYINLPEINPEHVSYIEQGLLNIIKTGNCGSLEAFSNGVINERGIFLDKATLTRMAKTFEIDFNTDSLPEVMMLTIRKSPISLFKRWVFKLTDKPFLSMAKNHLGHARDFFPLLLRDELSIMPLTTNIAHERFLLSVYSRKRMEEAQFFVNTPLEEGNKFVIYKDYAQKKISTLKLKRTLPKGKMHNFDIRITREPTKIKFKVLINHRHFAEHVIRFKKPIKISYSERTLFDNKKLHKQNEKKVNAIIESFDGKTLMTNNYANISLGRIARVPILVTLPNREINANTKVSLKYDKTAQILRIYDNNNVILKELVLSTPPKSNWLKRLRG